MTQQPGTLYERLGGEDGLDSMVGEFYKRVFADPELGPFFENSAVERLIGMQREFFSAALDGPVTYSGLELSWAHSGRGITRKHFGLYVDHLVETLETQGVTPEDIEQVIHRITLYADDVIGEGGVDG